MKPKGKRWQDRVCQEANFLPKRLSLIALLLLALYCALLLRTEWFLRADYTGLVEARLSSKLTADYQLTEAPALAFGPLSFALIEAKIRDENSYLSEEAVARLVQRALAAAYAPIVTATPTPDAVANAVIQAVSFVTESVAMANGITFANRAPGSATANGTIGVTVFATPALTTRIATQTAAGQPLATHTRTLFSTTPTLVTVQQATPAPQPVSTGFSQQMAVVPLTPTAIAIIPNGTVTIPATALPTRITVATNKPAIQLPLQQPVPTATATVGASAGSSAAIVVTSTPWLWATLTPSPTPPLLPTATATLLPNSVSSLTFVQPTVTETPIVTPIAISVTVLATTTPLPSPSATMTPTLTTTASPTMTATATAENPPTVVNLAAYVENDKVYLTWLPNSTDGIVSYNLYRSHTNTVEAVLVNSQPLTSLSYIDIIRPDGNQWVYVVTAINQSDQESPPSQAVMITTTDQTPPQTPSNLSMNITGNLVKLHWQASTAPDLAGYNIYRSNRLPFPENPVPLNGGILLSEPAYQEEITLNGESYFYVFTAVDFSGNESPYSMNVQAFTVDREVPAPPTGLTAIFQDNRVLLQWQANSEADVTGYRLYRDWTTPVATSQPIHSEPLLTAHQYYDETFERGATYSYVLVAVDSSENRSSASEAVTLTVPE